MDFKYQIDRALKIFHYQAHWKSQLNFKKIINGVFHEFGKDPQNNQNIWIFLILKKIILTWLLQWTLSVKLTEPSKLFITMPFENDNFFNVENEGLINLERTLRHKNVF